MQDVTTSLDARPIPQTGAAKTARDVVQRLFRDTAADVALELGDGTRLYEPADRPSATIVIRHPGVLRALLIRSSDLATGEALVRGDIAVLGDAERAFAAIDAVAAERSPTDWLAIVALSARLPRSPETTPSPGGRGPARLRGRLHTLARDRAAIAYHYDVSNDFYRLWLDRDLTYSCAYFRDEGDSLDDAQQHKFEHICRKLRLQRGERLLDVGCGWGGLVRFAAREYGARAVGITLSQRQVDYARERIAAEGLAGACTIELLDYRELKALGAFDKAASVGMVEHVGEALLPIYFRSVLDALRPGGLFLNHGITVQREKPTGLRALAGRFFPERSNFIEQYVFPDGEIPRLAKETEAAEDVGFEVRDVENLREHYASTLRQWVRRLEAHESEARALVGDATYNTWRFYMSGSAHNFATGRLGLVQMLLAKRSADGRSHLPPTRADIYEART